MTTKPITAAPAFGLSYDSFGRLVMIDADGVRHVGVEPVRAFPMSDPQRWISICDATGRELVSIPDLAAIPPATAQTIEEDLARREFVPVIRRIVSISTEADPSEWEVETDRGPTRFVLNSEDDIRRLGRDRALLIDAQGVRYLIADIRRLDAASRRSLANYL